MRRIAWALAGVIVLAGCSTGVEAHRTGQPGGSAPGPGTRATASPPSVRASRTSAATQSPATVPAPNLPGRRDKPPALVASPGGGPGRLRPTAAWVLHGKVVVIDPGHNGGNAAAPAVINRPIWNGRETEACDTTGTQTDSGYTEARFNWNVARYLTADLRAEGATVVITRTTNTGVGPCVTRRAAIGNHAHADAALSIHADGGPPGGRGFAILEPVADGINNHIIDPSARLGADLRTAFAAGTGEPASSYDGTNGIQHRDD